MVKRMYRLFSQYNRLLSGRFDMTPDERRHCERRRADVGLLILHWMRQLNGGRLTP